MIRIFTALILLAAPAILSAQALDGTLKKIADSKTVTIAYRTDALPFSFEGDGKQPAGYTVELCKRIVASLERQLKVQPLQIKWVPATSQNRLELVRKGQADMECGSTTVTLSRMSEVDFSSYIFVDSTGLLVRNAAGAKSFQELAGKRIAVIGNTTNQAALDAAMKKARGGRDRRAGEESRRSREGPRSGDGRCVRKRQGPAARARPEGEGPHPVLGARGKPVLRAVRDSPAAR